MGSIPNSPSAQHPADRSVVKSLARCHCPWNTVHTIYCSKSVLVLKGSTFLLITKKSLPHLVCSKSSSLNRPHWSGLNKCREKIRLMSVEFLCWCMIRTHLEQGSDLVLLQVGLDPGLLLRRHGSSGSAAAAYFQRDEITG